MRLFCTTMLFLFCASFAVAQSSYTETIGSVSGIVFIPDHEAANAFDNDNLTYSGSGDVRNSAPSTGQYTGASGGANVLLNQQNEDFIVTGLTPNQACVSIDLKFGLRKSRNNENGSGFAAEYSTDGGANWTSAGPVVLPTGSGTVGWYLVTLTGLPGNANAFRFRKVSFNPGSSFRVDDLIITGNGAGCSLPIELAAFDVKTRPDGSAELNWATASETNNHYFLVERAADGHSFVSIGRLEGAGTTTEWQSYSFRDEQPAPGRNYYRLKQVDFDEKYAYSPVRSVTFPRNDRLNVFPSPAADLMQVQLKDVPAEPVRWEIFDATGRLAQTGVWPGEATQFELEVGVLSPGTYLLRLVIGREVLAKSFSKQ